MPLMYQELITLSNPEGILLTEMTPRNITDPTDLTEDQISAKLTALKFPPSPTHSVGENLHTVDLTSPTNPNVSSSNVNYPANVSLQSVGSREVYQ